MSISLIRSGPVFAFSTDAAVTVTTAWTLLGEIVIGDQMGNGIEFQVDNTGAADLTDFKIESFTPNGTTRTLLTGTDWASSSIAILLEATTPAPNTCSAGSQASATVSKPGTYKFEFWAKCGSSTTVTLDGHIEGR